MTLCEECTAYVNESFIFGTTVHHPVGRPCGKVEPPKKRRGVRTMISRIIRRWSHH